MALNVYYALARVFTLYYSIKYIKRCVLCQSVKYEFTKTHVESEKSDRRFQYDRRRGQDRRGLVGGEGLYDLALDYGGT